MSSIPIPNYVVSIPKFPENFEIFFRSSKEARIPGSRPDSHQKKSENDGGCSDYFYVTVYDVVVVGTISRGNNRGIFLVDDNKHARENGVAGDQEVAGIYFTYWYIIF